MSVEDLECNLYLRRGSTVDRDPSSVDDLDRDLSARYMIYIEIYRSVYDLDRDLCVRRRSRV